MNNVLIILTSTVYINPAKHFLYQTNPNERLECYLKSVKQWLEKTSFKICLVENSNYTFPELNEYVDKFRERFEIITIDEFNLPEEDKHLIYNCSKGASEMYSIIYAYNNSKFKNSVNFIIKITARYFIEQLESFLIEKNIANNVHNVGIVDYNTMILGLRQSNQERCELLGVHKKFFNVLFELNLSDDHGYFYSHVESVYCNRMKLLNQDRILVCPTFAIEPTQMGGISHINTDL
jgi:hypothetical protein